MISTQEAPPSPGGARSRVDWLILVHQIPPKPDYFRVKVRRRLQRLGAVALKNSVYLLPRRAETREDFEWLVREIQSEGGEATLCRGTLLAGTSDEEVQAMFQSERDADYAAIAEEARALGQEGDPGRDELARLKRRLEEVERIDYFAAPAGDDARRAVAAAASSTAPEARRGVAEEAVRGAVWVTRTGVKVDRIASAWLIRRF
ncbi:MAG TPA: Chromate resistance protein ChrB, partial [Gemmatimonadales bacterium]|nr:Chromate resistance protein ChrB [Gemmatimonadales bacterium]